MSITADNIISVVSAIACCGVLYGVMRTKVDRLEEDNRSLSNRLDATETRFVTLQHFDAVVKPLQDSMKEIERDIKKILNLVTTYNRE